MPGVRPEPEFLAEVEAASGQVLSACYQCRKCSVGCPVAFALDLLPHQVVRLVQFGQRDRVLDSATPWVCAACETCTTRCPNEIDIAGLMNHLKNLAFAQGRAVEPGIVAFHRTFLSEIKKRGRIFEAALLPRYLLASGRLGPMLADGSLWAEARLGLALVRRGRMKLVPGRVRGRRETAEIIKGV